MAWAGSGCRRQERFPLESVELAGDTVTDNAVLGMSPGEIRRAFEDVLRAHKGFELPTGQLNPKKDLSDGAPARLVLELVYTRFMQRESGGRTLAEVGAKVRISRRTPEGEFHYELPASGEVEVKTNSEAARRDAVQAALHDTLEAAARAVHFQLAAAGMPEGKLEKELASGDPARRDAALRVLADRRSPAATTLLLERLRSDDATEVRRAMGQLVEIGDARAVPALIELAQGKDPSFQREVLYALGALGGDEAEAYLYTVAQGHDQPLVRQAAQEALDELHAHATSKQQQRPDASANNREAK